MHKVVLLGYFADTSIFSGKIIKGANRGEKNYACRYAEMYYLAYLYVKAFFPSDYHVVFTDCGSDLPIDWMVEKFEEPVDFIKENDFKLDFSKKIHIRKFSNKLDHLNGFPRVVRDWQMICFENNIDFFLLSSDALFAYDVSKDLENKDFVCSNFRKDCFFQDTIDQDVLFLSKKLLKGRYFGCENVKDFIEKTKDWAPYSKYLTCAEGGLTRFYKTHCSVDRIGKISRKDLFIHDCGVDEFKKFVAKNPISHPFLQSYIDNLK
jgi:hypothetical protein